MCGMGGIAGGWGMAPGWRAESVGACGYWRWRLSRLGACVSRRWHPRRAYLSPAAGGAPAVAPAEQGSRDRRLRRLTRRGGGAATGALAPGAGVVARFSSELNPIATAIPTSSTATAVTMISNRRQSLPRKERGPSSPSATSPDATLRALRNSAPLTRRGVAGAARRASDARSRYPTRMTRASCSKPSPTRRSTGQRMSGLYRTREWRVGDPAWRDRSGTSGASADATCSWRCGRGQRGWHWYRPARTARAAATHRRSLRPIADAAVS